MPKPVMLRDEIYDSLENIKATRKLRSFSDAIQNTIDRNKELEIVLKLKEEELKRHDNMIKLAQEILNNQK